MTRAEALDLVKLWEHWNQGQKSVTHAFGGPRTAEDDLLDEKRKLLLKAYQTLNNDSNDQGGK